MTCLATLGRVGEENGERGICGDLRGLEPGSGYKPLHSSLLPNCPPAPSSRVQSQLRHRGRSSRTAAKGFTFAHFKSLKFCSFLSLPSHLTLIFIHSGSSLLKQLYLLNRHIAMNAPPPARARLTTK